MELVANKINGCFFENILPPEDAEIDRVFAAIAYGRHENEKFIKQCAERPYRLDIWMRYDHTVPVTPQLLKDILKNHSKNVFCYLIRDYLHSKIIWWKGYGVYIGSANLTDRAWTKNIEAGLFLTHEEIQSSSLAEELEVFFHTLNQDRSDVCLKQDIINEMEALVKKRKEHKEKLEGFASDLAVPAKPSPIDVTKIELEDRLRGAFHTEWQETRATLNKIAEQIVDCKPAWLDENFPSCWQADQFLHAYYWNEVKEKDSKAILYEDFHEKHKNDPQSALEEAMQWWHKLKDAPSGEDENLEKRATYIREHLAKDKVLALGVEEIKEIIYCTHSTSDYVKRHLRASVMNRLGKVGEADRFQWFAEYLLKNNIQQLWHDVLYGTEGELWERLFEAIKGKHKIPHYGENSWSEVVGWARPEIVPPCNGRTKKALYALGYPVKI